MPKRNFTGASLILSWPVPRSLEAPPCAENRAEQLETPSSSWIGITPLPGFGVPGAQVPANVQAVTERRSRGNTAQPAGIHEPAAPRRKRQRKPEQPLSADVHFRGFSGLRLCSARLRGSRCTRTACASTSRSRHGELDLIPGSAISTINLIPGSNPLFGLNARGRPVDPDKSGAGSIRERRLRSTADRSAGARWRRSTALRTASSIILRARAHFARTGGARSRLPTCASFLPARLADGTSDLDLSITHAESDLTGNGPAAAEHGPGRSEAGLHAERPYSQPMTLFSLTPPAGSPVICSGRTVYYRQSEKEHDQRRPQRGQRSAQRRRGLRRRRPQPSSVNRTRTSQRGYGFSTQAALTSGNLSGPRNLVIVGGGYDRSASDFRQKLPARRFSTPTAARRPPGAETEIVNLEGGSATASLFATDTRSPSPRWHFTGSARYNVTRVRTVDLLSPPLPPPAAGLGSDLSFAK